MADKEHEDGPSLEMPSLGSLFQRKEKPKSKGRAKGRSSRGSSATSATREDFDALVRGKRPEPEAPAPEPKVSTPEPEAPAATEKAAPAKPAPAKAAADAPTKPAPVPAAPEVEKETAAAAEPTVVLPPEPEPETETILDEVPDEEDERDDEEQERPAAKKRRPKREFSLPQLPPLASRTAAAVTGLVIGVLAVLLTFGSLRGCEAVKGTSSCGTPGFFLLIAIMITLVALGSAMLAAWKVTDPTSTSFLAVGLLAVIALLFLIRVIFSPWMALVIPVIAVITYVASQWLTTLFEDEDVVPE